MLRAAMLSLCLSALIAFGAGCYDTPMPACTFACGAGGECPTGYACSSVDNICKRDDIPADHMCEGLVIADASVVAPDAPVTDAAVDDAPVADAAVDDAAVPDAMVPDAVVPDAVVPDAFMPDAFMPDAMAVCGDGTMTPPEACDDFNNNSCGSCNMGCSAVQTPTAATGSITVVAGANLVDGETFTIDDGFNSAVTFEFDSDASNPTNAVTFTAGDTAEQVEAAIIAAINNVVTGLIVTASDGGAGVVTLTHDRLSSAGNQTVTETVTDAGFVVSGLSGGVAGDCPATTGCSSGDDCLSGSCGSSVANQCD